MKYDPNIHHRRSIRIQGYDYSEAGAYFVTVCSAGTRPLFGKIHNSRMLLNELGEVIEGCWEAIPDHFPMVGLDEYVIMPNHMHGILVLTSDEEGDACVSPTGTPGPQRGSVGAMVGSFKAAVSKEMRSVNKGFASRIWQRNYYEHVIRDDESLNRIREYILTNPQRWDLDRENPHGRGTDDFDRWLDSFKNPPARR